MTALSAVPIPVQSSEQNRIFRQVSDDTEPAAGLGNLRSAERAGAFDGFGHSRSLLVTSPTANPRWRFKPCTSCDAMDWMFGRKHLCINCQPTKSAERRATPGFPPDAVQKMRRMRALGATWKVIAIPFDCDWHVARNFFLSNCGQSDPDRHKLASLLHIAERELRA